MSTPTPTLPPAARRAWLARLVGGFALLLVGVTWPLWMPPTPENFPQLPLVAWLIEAPAWCDRVALAGVLLGAAGMLFTPTTPASGGRQPSVRWREAAATGSRFAPALFAASLAFACLLNQIRVQVWAYQFLLLAGALTLCPRTEPGDRAAVTLARALAVGILFHSALSKLDLAFAQGPGRWLMGGFLGLFGLDSDAVDPKLVSAAAFAVPAWELALSVLLAVPSLRRAGLAGAVVMHAALVATLWRLDQSWGVLLWNAFFLAHEFVLFRPEPRGERLPAWTAVRSAGGRAWPAALLTLAAVTLPFGTRAGSWDVWPGWAVYAGTKPQVLIRQVAPPEVLGPQSLRFSDRFRPAPPPDADHPQQIYYINLERRALAELHVPLPQDPRVRVGVAAVLWSRRRHGNIRIDVQRVPGWGWWSTEFETDTVMVPPDPERKIDELLDAFLLNARPRALSLPPDAR